MLGDDALRFDASSPHLNLRKYTMRKPRLMTPGPSMVPEDVLLELARPVIHHRSDEAKEVITEVIAGLKEVFRTKNDVLILTASGTGAMEAAAVNIRDACVRARCSFICHSKRSA